jgi:uncharacterized protein YfaS (alpha-2-macroglobulin family)
MKGMIALALYRGGDREAAEKILSSLRETAIRDEEFGVYWLRPGRSWWWHEAAIEGQALLVEAFREIANDTALIDDMRLWLLQQKRTQDWGTTKATADACYAFLLGGASWLGSGPEVTIRMGSTTINSAELDQEAGTGYFKTAFDGEQISTEMGNITVTTRPTTKDGTSPPMSWGAVYWQYFEQMDKITASASPMSVKKQLMLERQTDRGPELVPLTSERRLQVGDRVKIRLEITTNRDIEYVHLKDMRGAGFEPVQTLSGFRWQGGFGYYESIGDISSNFFIHYLPKGKYVFEYPMVVTHKGTFSTGMATIQCMYAPEFSAHSAGIAVSVE